MSLALYRKYRPQSWSDLTGQNHIKVTLKNEIESDKISHAYLFTGPRGIGKTTTARLFAKAINCLNRKEGESEPCNKCDSCLELVIGNDLDIMEIDAASHTGVDNVRENIIANARFTPVKRKFKVFIIDEVHMLSISAFNALLKILEEPPSHAIFILATTEVHKVPATIISRCQRFDFKKINIEELVNRLSWICQQEKVRVSKNVLNSIARASEGSLRDAESLLGQVLSLGDKEISEEEASLIIPASNYNLVLELLDDLIYKNIEKSIGLINRLVDEGVDLLQFTDDLLEFLRKIILAKISGNLKDYSLEVDDEMEKKTMEISKEFSVADLVILIKLFSEKKFEIKTAAIPQLPLEIAIIEYCSRADKEKDSGPGGDSRPPKLKNEQGIPIAGNVTEVKSQAGDKSGAKSATLKIDNLSKAGSSLKVKLAEIRDKWHNFIVRMQDQNASLVFILKVAEPIALEGNILKIGFKYKFHLQHVNQAKVKEVIEKVLKDFFGEQIFMEPCILENNYQSEFINQQTRDDEVELIEELPGAADLGENQELIDSLVKTFNGKIVG
jgi:DNA polymerase-3 subunit gamma/tau